MKTKKTNKKAFVGRQEKAKKISYKGKIIPRSFTFLMILAILLIFLITGYDHLQGETFLSTALPLLAIFIIYRCYSKNIKQFTGFCIRFYLLLAIPIIIFIIISSNNQDYTTSIGHTITEILRMNFMVLGFLLIIAFILFWLIQFVYWIIQTIRYNKIKQKPMKKETYFRVVSYFLYFYFGMRLLILPILAFQEEVVEFFGIFDIIFNIGIALFGLYATYQLRKMKKWALIALIALFILSIISILVTSNYLGETKLPTIQVVALAFLIGGYRQLKKNE